MKDIARVGNTFMTWEDFYRHCLCNEYFLWRSRALGFGNCFMPDEDGAVAYLKDKKIWMLINEEEFTRLCFEEVPKQMERIEGYIHPLPERPFLPSTEYSWKLSTSSLLRFFCLFIITCTILWVGVKLFALLVAIKELL